MDLSQLLLEYRAGLQLGSFPAHGISVYRDHRKTVYHDPGNSAYRFHHRVVEALA